MCGFQELLRDPKEGPQRKACSVKLPLKKAEGQGILLKTCHSEASFIFLSASRIALDATKWEGCRFQDLEVGTQRAGLLPPWGCTTSLAFTITVSVSIA